MAETPTITGYCNSSNSYAGLPVGNAAFISNNASTPASTFWIQSGLADDDDAAEALEKLIAETQQAPVKARRLLLGKAAPLPSGPISPAYQPKETIVGRRIVQVYIADPDENVPLDDSILYTGTQKMTDLTDQELFFEIDINNILKQHNAKRVTFVNKKVKERVENLEPVKVRDLRMVVTTVAQF